MCGFCCFSMRFVVFIDLFGTIILPATCAYLGYLIYRAASHTGQFPIISIIMLAAVYGLQAIIFIIKRQWQHVGWMIIYIIAFPIYSFLLPLYAFWRQDDFSWGSTRIVVGEKGEKRIIEMLDDEGFDRTSIPLQRWDDYAAANNLPGRRGGYNAEKGSYEDGPTGLYEMDDMQSVYSSAKPASTVFPAYGVPPGGGLHMPPTPSANPYGHMQRQSTYSNLSGAGGANLPELIGTGGGVSELPGQNNPYAKSPYMTENLISPSPPAGSSTPNLLGTPGQPARAKSPLARPNSQLNFMDGPKHGPSDQDIVAAVRECLMGVDLDHVTKKQVRALVEQRLQTQLLSERKAFLDQIIDVELANM